MLGITTFITLVGVASAQINIPGFYGQVSSQCAGAVAGVIADSDANACLLPSTIQSLAAGFSNHSLIGLDDAWSESVCSSALCTNATLASVITNVASGCKQEFGIDGDVSHAVEDIITIVQAYYPTVRMLVCLKDGDTSCGTQTLLNLENFVGQPGLGGIIDYIRNNGLEGLPNSIVCTDCTKAANANLEDEQSWILGYVPYIPPSFPIQCGNDFTDENIPSNIHVDRQSRNAASSNVATGGSSNNSGATILTAGMSFSALSIVSLIVAVLF